MMTNDNRELTAIVDDLKKTYEHDGITTVGFRPGHQRIGGRRKGSLNKRTRHALEICESLDFHPAAFLATIALTGLMPNPDGTTVKVTTEDRLKAAVNLCPFVMPRLQATQLTGANDGPVEVASFDIAKLLQDPALVEQVQTLSLALTEADVLRTEPEQSQDDVYQKPPVE